MKPSLSPRAILAVLAPCCALLLACGGSVTTPWDTVPQKTGSAVAKEAKEGSEFNKFFPKGGDGWDVTYTQEKKGFAAAILKKDGKEMATLAVFDVLSNPEVPKDYENSTEKIGGYPAVAKGSLGTAVLIADRFQVQVRSTKDGLTKDQRAEWIQKFDLAGLANLQ